MMQQLYAGAGWIVLIVGIAAAVAIWIKVHKTGKNIKSHISAAIADEIAKLKK